MNYETKQILVLGSFDDANNIGDTAILSALISDLATHLPHVEFTIPVKRRRALQPFPVRTIWSRILFYDPLTIQAIFRSDLVLVTAGNVFDTRLFDITFNRLFGYAYLCTLASWLDKKIAFCNAGLGPITTELGDRIARHIVRKADLITLRDTRSLEYLNEWEIKAPHWVAADSALSIRPVAADVQQRIWEDEQIDPSRTNVAINVTGYIRHTFESAETGLTEQQFVQIIAQTADWVVERLNGMVFFIVTSRSDEPVHQRIIDAMHHQSQAHLILPMLKYTPQELVSILEGMSLMVGSRMHSLILSAAAGTPMVGLVYAPKTRHFLEDIGQKGRDVELRSLSVQHLVDQIGEILQHRADIVQDIVRAITPLQAKAQESARHVADLIR